MRRMIIYVIASLGLAACSTEVAVDGRTDDGVANVRFSVRTPDFAERAATRSTIYTENADNTVYDLGVLAFTDADLNGAWEFSYGAPLTGSDNVYAGSLMPSADPVKLIVLANVIGGDDAFAALPTVGASEADVRKFFVVDRAQGFTGAATDRMPMYGEVVLSEIKEIYNAPVQVVLTRSAAKVHVTKNLTAASEPFQIEEVLVYNYSTAVQVLPDAGSMDAGGELVASSIPALMPSYSAPFSVGVTEQGDDLVFDRTVIVAESSAACVVIGGVFDGGKFYYRVDFDPESVGTVIRNREYVLNITSVVGEGYATADEAAAAPANSTVVDQTWYDEFETIWFSTGADDAARMEQTEVTLASGVGSVSSSVVVESARPFVWWIDDSTAPDDQSEQSNEEVMVSVSPGGGTSTYSATVSVQALSANSTGADRTGKIYFSFASGSVGGSITWIQSGL